MRLFNLLRYSLVILVFHAIQFKVDGQCADFNVTIDAVPGAPFCKGDTLTLTAIATGGTEPYTYAWETGATTQSIIHICEWSDHITVVVTDALGCVDEYEIKITIPFFSVTIDWLDYVCEGDSLELSVVIVPLIFNPQFEWSTGGNWYYEYITTSGTYSVTVTEANSGCTLSDTAYIEVNFVPLPEPEIQGPSILCPGEEGTLTVTGGPYVIIVWSTGDGEPTIPITDPGIYTILVVDEHFCVGYDTLEIISGGTDPILSGTSSLCTGQSGTVEVTNASSFISFLWNGGQNTSTITINGPGTYTVTVTEAGGCTAIGSFTVDPANSNINISGTTLPVTSCIAPDGSIDLDITPSGTYTFIWSNGASTEDINNLSPGTYIVTVTDTGGCTLDASFTIDNNTILPIPTLTIVAATCGQSNGAVDLSISPSGSYTFNWSNGTTIEDLINIAPGSYSVTVTSAFGCTATASATVNDNPVVINISENITHNSSCLLGNGTIDISITPAGIYTFLWSNGATTEDLDSLAPGNYSVTVSTGINCSSSATYIVQSFTNDPDILSIDTPSTCGESNGAIDLQVSNGLPPYTFLWSNGNTTQALNNIPGNTYSVTVTGSNGCTSSIIVDLPDVNIPIAITSLIIPNTSCMGSDGSIDITLSPSGNFNFLWSTGDTTEDLTDIGAGTYIITVTLGINCLITESFTVTNENIPFDITGSSSPNNSCTTPNGAIDLTMIPPGAYTYDWSSGESSEDLQNLDAGVYIVTVTNIDGCSITSTFNIVNQFFSFVISGIAVPNTSCQVPNGSLDISLSPAGVYSFLWSNGATTEDLQNITAGVYGVTVEGAGGCTEDTVFAIEDQSSGFTLSAITIPNTSCVSPNGIVDLSVTPPGAYTYIWSNGTFTEDIQFLPAGLYSVTVSDVNNCSVFSSFSIDNNTLAPVISSLITDETCGSANGGIDLTVSPPGNTFLWSNGYTDEDLQNINSGTYIVTVTNSNGCSVQDTINVNNLNSNFSLSSIAVHHTSCIQPNGSLDLTVTPIGTYSFVWSTGETTEDILNLTPGQYAVTVTDSLNCYSILVIEIYDNTVDPVVSSIITSATCGQNDGAIELMVTPSTGNTFVWSNGDGNEDLINLAPGIYSVTVTGNNGCTATVSFEVPNNNSVFSIQGIVNANVSCNSPNGSIDINITPAGMYTYIWSNGSSSADLQNLTPGNYILTVSDPFNCSSTMIFTVDDNSSAPVLSQNIIPSTCGYNNGSIDISISPSGVYNIIWSNGNTNEDLLNVATGNYEVTVTDSNGCTVYGIFNVPNNNTAISITASITDVVSCSTLSGAIDILISPSGVYSYVWSNGATTEDLTSLSPGLYGVTVTDNFNCSTTESFIIKNMSVLPLISGIITHPSCGEENGHIDLTVVPANSYQFFWSTGDTSEDLELITSGVYSVTVVDVNGCSTSSLFNLLEPGAIDVVIDANITGLNNEMVTLTLQLNVPISTIDTIVWSPTALFNCPQLLCLEQTLLLTGQIDVMVIVIDTNGCMGQANILLDIDREYKVYAPNVFTPNGDGNNDMFTIYSNTEVEEVVRLEIFDRWGNCVFINKIFPPNEPGYGWNGIFKGNMMNPAVFAYQAIVRFSNGKEHSIKGDITLLR